MKISPLRLYNTAMWEHYNTPISRKAGDYITGVAGIVLAITLLLTIAVILMGHNYSGLCVLIPFAIYQIPMGLQFKDIDKILDLENESKIKDAEELHPIIRRKVKMVTIVTVMLELIVTLYFWTLTI